MSMICFRDHHCQVGMLYINYNIQAQTKKQMRPLTIVAGLQFSWLFRIPCSGGHYIQFKKKIDKNGERNDSGLELCWHSFEMGAGVSLEFHVVGITTVVGGTL